MKYTVTNDGDIHLQGTVHVAGFTTTDLGEANRVALLRCLDLQAKLPQKIADLRAKVQPKFALDDIVCSNDRLFSACRIDGVKRDTAGFTYLLSGGLRWYEESYISKVGN